MRLNIRDKEIIIEINKDYNNEVRNVLRSKTLSGMEERKRAGEAIFDYIKKRSDWVGNNEIREEFNLDRDTMSRIMSKEVVGFTNRRETTFSLREGKVEQEGRGGPDEGEFFYKYGEEFSTRAIFLLLILLASLNIMVLLLKWLL